MPRPKTDVLTARQQEVYDLYQANAKLTFVEGEKLLGVTSNAIRETYRVACKKKDHEPTPRLDRFGEPHGKRRKQKKAKEALLAERFNRHSRRSADEQGGMIDAATNPMLETIRSAAEEAGVSPRVMSAFMKRMDAELGVVVDEIKEVRLDHLAKLVGSKLQRVVESVSEDDIAAASLKDKAVFVGIFTEKLLLLRGQPTQILRIEERQQLDELAPQILDEAQRRGIELVQDPVTGEWGAHREEYNINSKELRKQVRNARELQEAGP